MENKNIKQSIVNLCNDFVVFWLRLKEEVNAIPDEDNTELVYKWNSYFPEHSDTIINLIGTKLDVEIVEKDLIEKGILKCDTWN